MANEYTKNQVFIDVDGSVIKDEKTTGIKGVDDRMKQTNKLIENDQRPKDKDINEPKFKFNLENMMKNVERYKEMNAKNNGLNNDGPDKEKNKNNDREDR